MRLCHVSNMDIKSTQTFSGIFQVILSVQVQFVDYSVVLFTFSFNQKEQISTTKKE